MANQYNMKIVSLLKVQGRDSQTNDIFFFSNGGHADLNIILFCGDLQNEMSIMSSNVQFGSLADKWSYEGVAKLFFDRMGSETIVHLWIIRASRWTQNTFAFYDHFVRYTAAGVPDYSGISNVAGTSFAAWRHLNTLMCNAVSRIEGASVDIPCSIIGFSKGCSVLTQLIYEMGFYFEDQEFIEDLRIHSKLISLTWLDSGHIGVSHLWPTWTLSLSRLRNFASVPKLFIFATPYQLCSDRPWNLRDFNTFLRTLQTYRLPFYVDTFYKGVHWQCPPLEETQIRSDVGIETHFEILECFPIHLCISPNSLDLI